MMRPGRNFERPRYWKADQVEIKRLKQIMKEDILSRVKIKVVEEFGRNIRLYSYLWSMVRDQTKKENITNNKKKANKSFT